jgi:sirohydrochlorin ferrochelatase
MRRLLAAEIGNPVTLGFVSAVQPELRAAVATVRRDVAEGGRVIIANYLLAPGHFADRVAAAGADCASLPLLDGSSEPPAELVEIVVDRFRDRLRSWSLVVHAAADGRTTES